MTGQPQRARLSEAALFFSRALPDTSAGSTARQTLNISAPPFVTVYIYFSLSVSRWRLDVLGGSPGFEQPPAVPQGL